MTSHRYTSITCDHPECWNAMIKVEGTASDVRKNAPHGWAWKYSHRHGGWVDLCPEHSQ